MTLGCDHLKEGRALPPGHYLSPAGGRGTLSASGVLSSTYASIYVRAGRAGPSLRSAVITSRGDVRSLPVTTSHQWGDVVPSRRAVCSPRPTRRSTCARAGRARRYVRQRSAVITSRGGRALPPGHYLSPAGGVGGRGPLSASGALSSTYASIYGLRLGSPRSAVPPSPVRLGEGCGGKGVPRAGPAGPLRWGRCPATLAVPLPLPLRSIAGGRRRVLPAPRWGVSPLDQVP